MPGFVDADEVQATLARALCMLLPSRREGYGMIVVEAAALGTPSIVVRGPDNAAVELIGEGENGMMRAVGGAGRLAAAIIRISEAGAPLRESTAAWYPRNATRLSLSQLARSGRGELHIGGHGGSRRNDFSHAR